jgi:hypothetical protein
MGYIGNSYSQQLAQPATQFFSGNGSTTAFTLSQTPQSVYTVEVVVNNVQQNPQTSYYLTGNILNFYSAPPSGSSNIYVVYNPVVTVLGQPGYGAVGPNQLAPNAVTSSSMAVNAVTSASVAAGAIVESGLAAGAVTYSKLGLTPSIASTYTGSTTMSGGSNWFDTTGQYFGCEIQPATKLTNGVTYYQIQGRLPTTLSGFPSNPTVWVLFVSHPTGVPAPGNTITIVSGWRFMLPNGTNGDLFTVNFDNAIESFGSAKIPVGGNYYIGWAHTLATGQTGLTGAYWVDNVEGGIYAQGAGSGTVYYQSNPGPIHPRTITPANGPVGKGMHWRFYQKPDYDIKGVNTIQADTIRSNFSIRVDNKLAGVYELVNHTAWRSSTSAVYFAFQPQLYSHYKLYWNINHGPSWTITQLRFTDSTNNPISGANYANSGYWVDPSTTSLTVNSSYFGASNSFIWLAGNGTTWCSSGETVIYPGDDYINGLGVNRAATTGNRFPTVRGKANLYGNGGSTSHYMEEHGGTYWGSTQCAGFAIYGSGGASSLGDIYVYGARYE